MAGKLVPSEEYPLNDRPVPVYGETAEPGYGASGGSGNPIGPKRILGVLIRARYWLALAAIVGLAAGYGLSRLIPLRYSATATVFIDKRDKNLGGGKDLGPITAEQFLTAQQWPKLATNERVIDPVVDSLRLYIRHGKGSRPALFAAFEKDSVFSGGPFVLKTSPDGKVYTLHRVGNATRFPIVNLFRRIGPAIESGQVGDSIGKKARLGWKWQPSAAALGPNRTVEFEIVHWRTETMALQKRLHANVDGQQFLKITLTGDDPDRVSKAVNAITASLLEVARHLKTDNLKKRREELQNQVDSTSRIMTEKAMALQTFRTSIATKRTANAEVSSGADQTPSTVKARWFGRMDELAKLQKDKRDLLALLTNRTADGNLKTDDFRTIDAVRNAPELTTDLDEIGSIKKAIEVALTKYTEKNSQVKALRERLTILQDQAVPARVRQLAARLQQQIDDLEPQIEADRNALLKTPEITTTEDLLAQEYEYAKKLNGTAIEKLDLANLAAVTDVDDIKPFVDATPPTKPSGLTPPLLMLAGILAGIALAAAIVIARDILDGRFRYPEQVTGGSIGLTILGVVPDARRGRLSHKENIALVVEAFREIRMNIVHSFPDQASVTLTISSPAPQEGKSFVSINLASSFAQAGYKTLLIDGDTRRGYAHDSFKLERRPGLIDHLLGRVGIDQIIRKTQHENLWMIPCGEYQTQSPELLGSQRMRALFEYAKANYDVVLFDSPPFNAGVDAYVLGTLTGSLAVVMRSGQTDRELTEAKLKVLDRLPIRPLGAILNAVKIGASNYRYYISYGYTTEEPEVEKQLVAGAEASAETKEG